MTMKARMLELISTFTGEDPVVREIAKWIVSDDDLLAGAEDADDADDFMNALRERWPKASDEDIARGVNMSTAVAEALKPN
jgi:hypothetical protein